MKWIALVLSLINLFLGTRALLNAVHILHTSKYSQAATVMFTLLFLAMAAAGFYFSLVANNSKLAIWAGIGPWIIALFFLLFNILTGDYK